MLTDQLINFVTADFAKSAGFDIEVETNFYRFINNKGISEEITEGHQSTRRNFNHPDFGTIAKYWSRPTQALLHRWLREIKNQHLTVLQSSRPYGLKYRWRHFPQLPETDYYFTVSNQLFDTWEEAMEAGLQYCLNRVLQSKEN